MKVKEFKEHILKYMTAEEALDRLLASSLINYEKLKFSTPENSVHPEIIIAMAAFDLGWDVAVEKQGDGLSSVRGLTVGTKEYMDKIFKK